ncbi:hypothetical protein [Clavibacter sp. CFBP 8614]|uniref:hypothetical protein n=1 Tax=unclassified Clavibacter TaxID=2626594 RepID=UPI004042F598
MPLDTRPLTERVDRRAVREYRRTLPEGAIPLLSDTVLDFLRLAGWPLLLVVTMLLGIDAGNWTRALPIVGIPLLPVLIGATIAARALRKRSGVRQYRLHRFAEANGLTYWPVSRPPRYPGMVLARPFPYEHRVHDRFLRRDGRPFDLGDYSWKRSNQRIEPTHRWGYVMIPLPTRLPHIVLDSRSNDSLWHPGLPDALDRDQRVSLEGDFDRHFTLYCPRGYERDALYLFTPDVMARFIDTASGLDVEIIDEYLLMYSPGGLVTTDPAAWEALMVTVDAVQEKVARWSRWRDATPAEETAAAGVASGARHSPRHVATRGRLTTHLHWWQIAIIAIAIIVVVLRLT